MLKKHSVTIAGHRTSLTLETAFWDELKKMALKQNKSINTLVTELDAKRPLDVNLCSALRLAVLDSLKNSEK